MSDRDDGQIGSEPPTGGRVTGARDRVRVGVSTMLALVLWAWAAVRRVTRLAARDDPGALGRGYSQLFVVGCPRSGTTWVHGILAEHPLVFTGFTDAETHAYRDVWPRVVGTRRPRVLRWASVLAQDARRRARPFVGMQVLTDRRGLARHVAEALSHPEWSDEDAATWVIWRSIDRFMATTGAGPDRVFAEKTPDHLSYAREILDRFPSARLVEVVRDGRDVCVSMQMLRLRQRWPPATREAQVRRWAKAVRQGLELRSDPDLAGRILLLRYEDLQRDRAPGIRSLFDFAGLPHDPDLVDRVIETTSIEKTTRPTGPGFFTRKGTVGDWREHFTPEDEELFRTLAGDVFEAVGYQD